MTVRYLEISIQIHGLAIEDEAAVNFLTGLIKEATKGALLGHNKDLFSFRNEFESDIQVEVETHAGEFS
jgi:hypothetical protein